MLPSGQRVAAPPHWTCWSKSALRGIQPW